MRSLLVASLCALGASSCDKVERPTPAGTVIFAWDRSTATTRVMGRHPHQYPPHPLRRATILDGPVKARFRVSSQPLVGEAVVFDLEIASADVTFEDDGIQTARWSPVNVKATVVSNDAYAIEGRCEDAVRIAEVAPGKVGDVTVDCRVVARRPSQLGEEDGLTATASMRIEGKGRLLTNQIDVAAVEVLRD